VVKTLPEKRGIPVSGFSRIPSRSTSRDPAKYAGVPSAGRGCAWGY
jgi:hypothetical protein